MSLNRLYISWPISPLDQVRDTITNLQKELVALQRIYGEGSYVTCDAEHLIIALDQFTADVPSSEVADQQFAHAFPATQERHGHNRKSA